MRRQLAQWFIMLGLAFGTLLTWGVGVELTTGFEEAGAEVSVADTRDGAVDGAVLLSVPAAGAGGGASSLGVGLNDLRLLLAEAAGGGCCGWACPATDAAVARSPAAAPAAVAAAAVAGSVHPASRAPPERSRQRADRASAGPEPTELIGRSSPRAAPARAAGTRRVSRWCRWARSCPSHAMPDHFGRPDLGEGGSTSQRRWGIATRPPSEGVSGPR